MLWWCVVEWCFVEVVSFSEFVLFLWCVVEVVECLWGGVLLEWWCVGVVVV